MAINSSCSSFIFLISWLTFFLHLILIVVGIKTCSIVDPLENDCGKNVICKQLNNTSTGVCECNNLFHWENGVCVPITLTTKSPPSNGTDLSGDSTTALWFVIPCLIIIFVISAFLVAKRLKLIEKLYQFRVRRYNTVFVTSLQDDDAPIT